MLEKIDFSQPKMEKEEFKPRYDEAIQKLVVLQQQARSEGRGLVVLFEGWDGAGKGSRISDLMYELDARATTVHVTENLNFEEAGKFAGLANGVTGFYPMMQQFWKALGERSAITFFDCGWYTAAMEQVRFETFGKMSKKDAEKLSRVDLTNRAHNALPADPIPVYRRMAYGFEQMLEADGYKVVKLFIHVSKDVLSKRLEGLRDNPVTAWRATEEKSLQVKNYDMSYRIFDQLLSLTDFSFAPWTLVNGEDRRAANLLIAQTLIKALEGALEKQPNEAAMEAAAKAAANSAGDLIGEKADSEEDGDAATDDTQARLEAFEKLAAAQQARAPHGSSFIIMNGYPRIDHSHRGPSLDPDVDYKTELKDQQKRLFALESEMYQARVPLILMYEGWDAAGKGGNIKRVAQALDARAYTIFPSPAPTKPELAHPHLWRYWTRLPKAGHVGIYDRSWYGRVLVERIEGFASDDEWARAYDEINEFEYELVQWGAILLKFWVDITPEEQLARFEARATNPFKQWKITDEDWRNRDKYPLYKAAVDDMFRLTSTEFAPWILLESDDKQYARIQALRTINEALEERLHG